MLAALSIKAQPRAAKHDDKRAGHARGPSHFEFVPGFWSKSLAGAQVSEGGKIVVIHSQSTFEVQFRAVTWRDS
jgi:hypothetical protein